MFDESYFDRLWFISGSSQGSLLARASLCFEQWWGHFFQIKKKKHSVTDRDVGCGGDKIGQVVGTCPQRPQRKWHLCLLVCFIFHRNTNLGLSNIHLGSEIFGQRHNFHNFGPVIYHNGFEIKYWTIDSKAVSWAGVGYSLIISSSIKAVKGMELISGVAFSFGSCCCKSFHELWSL